MTDTERAAIRAQAFKEAAEIVPPLIPLLPELRKFARGTPYSAAQILGYSDGIAAYRTAVMALAAAKGGQK